ncbi:MAG: biotin synthase [Pseudomonadota bacterium]|jgi:biotin synthase
MTRSTRSTPTPSAPTSSRPDETQLRNWNTQAVVDLFERPFLDLLFQAQQVHRAHQPHNEVQLSTLLSIKTGGCAEDCGYCPQSAHHEGSVKAEKLMDVSEVLEAAAQAKAQGASRFCMGAAWRSPKDKDMDALTDMVRGVRNLGLETCMTLGMLSESQAQSLAEAGLDYYNHNLDTSADFYGQIISTRQFEDRLETLDRVRDAGIHVCCGGIVGMGETRRQRASLLATLANLSPAPESVPINQLVPVPGTPLHGTPALDPLEFVRTIAVARVLMPHARVRLSAGREGMSDELQTLCFMAGANSIFYGDRLLTTSNPQAEHDRALLDRLQILST